MKRAFVPAALAACAGIAHAQDSVLYVTDGDARDIRAVQGGALVDSNLDIGPSRRYRVAVIDTIWLGDMDNVGNIELDLNLDPTGNSSPPGLDIFEGTDGATDGKSNYTVESFGFSGGVYRYNTDWSGGELMFDVAGNDIVGITYDSARGHLWISDTSTIYEYNLTGELLGSFPHGSGRGCLAYESSSDTLWYVTNGTNTITEYNKDGELLDALSVTGLASNNWGAEFAMESAPCVADFDGNGILNLFDFLSFQTAFGNGEDRADLDGNGVLNLFDFLAFQTAFGNGC